MSPTPDLPPIGESATLDAAPYIAALQAMAAAAVRAAEAQDRLNGAIATGQSLMDSMAAQAGDLARAEAEVAAADSSAADAAAEAAVAAARAANAERDQATAAGAAATAGDAAAAAASALADANSGVARSAADADALTRALNASLRAEIGGAAAAAAANRALTGANEALREAAEGAAEAEAHLAEAEAAGSLAGYQDAQAAKTFAEADTVLAAAADEAADAVGNANRAYAEAIAAMGGYAAAAALTSGSTTRAGTAASAAGNSYRLLGTGIRLSGTAIHWLIAGTLEFLAVAIPAAIAFGDAMLVASQGAQHVYDHMSALWTAAEATGNQFHETAGQALGFSDALQRAQNQANGQVYEALGGTLDALGGKFSSFAAGSDQALARVKSGFSSFAAAGNQVLNQFDNLVAHIQYDLVTGAGGAVSQLLSHMVSDLTELGQVAGNVGHAILNLAAAMPGLAEVLLRVVDGASRLIEVLSSIPAPIIAVAMGLEEFWRWGGLAATVMGLLGRAVVGVIPALVGGLGKVLGTAGDLAVSFARFGGYATYAFGSLLSGVGKVVPGFDAAGTAVKQFGSELTYVESTATWGWAAIGVAAVIGLGYAFDSLRNSAQSFIATEDKAISSASDMTILNTIASGIGQATLQIQQQEAAFRSYSPLQQQLGVTWAKWTTSLQSSDSALGGAAQGLLNLSYVSQKAGGQWVQYLGPLGEFINGFSRLGGSAGEVASQIDQLTVAQKQWLQDGINVSQGAALISHQFGTTFVGSLALAQAAGVNLSTSIRGTGEAAVVARIKIADLVSGYQAMGQNSGSISSDMNLLAIQSGLAATKVQQLQQAMQAYDQQLSGGTGAVAGYVQSLRNVGDLAKGPVDASKAWSSFGNIVGSTFPNLVTWFQTAGAEGILSGKKMQQGSLDALSALVKFGQQSGTARSEILGIARAAGINVTSWKQLETAIGDSHAKIAGLGPIIAGVTGRMANLDKVASNLGNVLSSDITKTMDAAKVSASGLYTASYNLARALQQPHPPATVLHGDIQKLYDVQLRLTNSKSDASAYAQAFADGYGKVGQAAFRSWQQQDQAATQGTSKIRSTMQDSLSYFHQYGQEVGQAGQNAADQFASGFASDSGKVIAAMNSTAQNVQDKANNMASLLHVSGSRASSGMAQGIQGGSGQVISAAQGVTSAAAARASAMSGQFHSAGASASAGAAGGILAGEGAVVSAATAVANAASAAFAAHLHVKSPSTLTFQYGEWFAQGLADGMLAKEAQIAAAATRLAMAARGAMGINALTPMFTGLSTGGGGYSTMPVAAPVASGGGGVTVVQVHQEVHGHVLTGQQLMDFVRDGVQVYIPKNADNGFARRGRAS